MKLLTMIGAGTALLALAGCNRAVDTNAADAANAVVNATENAADATSNAAEATDNAAKAVDNAAAATEAAAPAAGGDKPAEAPADAAAEEGDK